jgi:hypothetical protein
MTESKVQIERRMSSASISQYVEWALQQAGVMREWAEWARDHAIE